MPLCYSRTASPPDLLLCGNGRWFILKYSSNQGCPTTLLQSDTTTQDPPADAYTLVVTVDGDQLQMTINSGQTHSVSNKDFPSTEAIWIVVSGENNLNTCLPGNSQASVVVQNFGYRAL